MPQKIERALLSVSDKQGIVALGRFLSARGVEILSTGGTAHALSEAGVAVIEVSDYTGFPEMLDGRVKTLHPKIHGGLLALRSLASHDEALQAQGIGRIDLVVVNLYPFEETVARQGATFADAIENIDIGGPTMLRSAAKNHQDVTVVVDPGDYDRLEKVMKENGGATTGDFRFACARKAFSHTAAYDGAIANYLTARASAGSEPEEFPDTLNLSFSKAQTLRYGENPHQRAAWYNDREPAAGTLARARQLHGKELSYNNLLDLHAGLCLVREFEEPAAAVMKHTNPCGAALGKNVAEAYRKARETDPVSAFGSIVGLNRLVDVHAAEAIAESFVEAVLAPSFEPAALELLRRKKNIRLLELDFKAGGGGPVAGPSDWDLRRILGGVLVQQSDRDEASSEQWKVVTRRAPTKAERRALGFAWLCCKHVKSNAIVFARDGQTLGVGAGQMSRVDAARLAAQKAQLPLEGSVAASDAFFPFRDGVDQIAGAGARAIVQPGGSVRDEEVIAAADEQGLAMLFTARRHFRH